MLIFPNILFFWTITWQSRVHHCLGTAGKLTSCPQLLRLSQWHHLQCQGPAACTHRRGLCNGLCSCQAVTFLLFLTDVMERVFFITSIIPVYPRFWIVPFVSSLRAFLASKVSPVGDFRLISPLRGADAVPSLSKDDLPEPLRLWTTVPSHPAALGSLVLVLGPPPAPHLTAGRSRGWCWCSALCAEQGRH